MVHRPFGLFMDSLKEPEHASKAVDTSHRPLLSQPADSQSPDSISLNMSSTVHSSIAAIRSLDES